MVGASSKKKQASSGSEKNVMLGARHADRNLDLLHSSCSCHLGTGTEMANKSFACILQTSIRDRMN
ncbi:hypothetical protein PVAP13_8KG286600 [Panicum virgatum]|uniref:Uncharacterized protein n=1 Tax=Panicum virgatum TaxID=38727 RepID=A0A8T0PM76_PANVG|nr:hypothetical protein PVAP13_8KG286600 [Panicum virgatum]